MKSLKIPQKKNCTKNFTYTELPQNAKKNEKRKENM